MTTKRITSLVAAGALTAAATVAIGATTWMGAPANAASEVRLHLGYDVAGDGFTYGSTVQRLTVGSNGCAINSAETLMDLESTAQTPPGLVGHSLGIKTGSTNGTPCGQIDSTESLTLRPVSELAGRTFTKVSMDVEVVGNAVVLVTLSKGSTAHTYTLQTGTNARQQQKNESDYDKFAPFDVSSTDSDDVDACAAASNSSPNSGYNDNCRWLITPSFKFDTIKITTSVGSVSLEGSSDYGNNTDFDTVFTLAPPVPVANNDSVTTNEDTAKTISDAALLANDTPAGGVSITGFTTPSSQGGSVTRVGGVFTYTPAANYNGPDSFTYSISDGSQTATGTVNVTVTAVNDAPQAVSSNQTMAEDTSKTITVGTDVDSTQLTSTCTGGSGGTITDNSNGTITYTPPLNFNGTVTISCSVMDDAGLTSSSNATIQVGVTPVNDAPVANDDGASVNQNTSIDDANVTITVLDNDSDVDDSKATLSVAVVTDGTHGHAVANANGTITYTPTLDADYSGPDTFTYRASDSYGGVSNTATVTVTINQVMCSRVPVPTGTFGGVYATFELRSEGICKPYTLSADEGTGTVLFEPVGDTQVEYRATISFGTATIQLNDGDLQLGIQYDPDGAATTETYRPLPPCETTQYDGDELIGATPPSTDSWCFAGVSTKVVGGGEEVSTWLVWGHDDPNFQR